MTHILPLSLKGFHPFLIVNSYSVWNILPQIGFEIPKAKNWKKETESEAEAEEKESEWEREGEREW